MIRCRFIQVPLCIHSACTCFKIERSNACGAKTRFVPKIRQTIAFPKMMFIFSTYDNWYNYFTNTTTDVLHQLTKTGWNKTDNRVWNKIHQRNYVSHIDLLTFISMPVKSLINLITSLYYTEPKKRHKVLGSLLKIPHPSASFLIFIKL